MDKRKIRTRKCSHENCHNIKWLALKRRELKEAKRLIKIKRLDK